MESLILIGTIILMGADIVYLQIKLADVDGTRRDALAQQTRVKETVRNILRELDEYVKGRVYHGKIEVIKSISARLKEEVLK